jgi:hypothetical protein
VKKVSDEVELHPAESMSLTVALAQVKRGESPTPNIATMCVYALARITGRYDWKQDLEDSIPSAEEIEINRIHDIFSVGPKEMFGDE